MKNPFRAMASTCVALPPRSLSRGSLASSAVTLALAGLALSALPAAAESDSKAAADGQAQARSASRSEPKSTARKDSAKGAAKPAPEPAAASGASVATRLPRQDPLDVLRDRLALRLGATPARVPDAAVARAVLVSSKATGEFRVPANAIASASRPQRGVAGLSQAAAGDPAAGPAVQGDQGNGSWAYAGTAGPEHWGRLKPDFSLCSKGQRQSPIDIRDGYALELEPVVFDYRPSRFQVVNSGHSLHAEMAPGNRITLSGRSYELVQFHFRNPAEGRINGRSFPMSAHLVHKDSEGRLAVVAVLLEHGPANPAVQAVWNHLPLELDTPEQGRIELNVADLLPVDRRYFTYMGSLTTPPCTEGVQWVVMQQSVSVSEAQHDFFARLYPMNARPLQALAGRIVKQSQ